ncbi:4-hydroxythreonine-4-phosphate dehydrogenase, partial [Candidatus Endoriftia persephone str. Guaymas]|nr:4-hydroxythreonine-4-phosphate dehydrogenase [Candidatus Endoriftia persephone str. Guaymas]
MMLPRIALTPGEPAGIGPDLCVMLAQQPMAGQLVAVADPQLLQRRAALLGLPLQITRFDPHTPATPNPPGSLPVLSVALAREEQ